MTSHLKAVSLFLIGLMLAACGTTQQFFPVVAPVETRFSDEVLETKNDQFVLRQNISSLQFASLEEPVSIHLDARKKVTVEIRSSDTLQIGAATGIPASSTFACSTFRLDPDKKAKPKDSGFEICLLDAAASGKFDTAFAGFPTSTEPPSPLSSFLFGPPIKLPSAVPYKVSSDQPSFLQSELAIKFMPGKTGGRHRLEVMLLENDREIELFDSSIYLPSNEDLPTRIDFFSAQIEALEVTNNTFRYRILRGFDPSDPLLSRLN